MAFSKLPFLCFVLCTCLVCSRSQEFFFELEDSEMNEVIFIGERDIVMRCGVKSSHSAYDIKVEHNGNVVVYNNGSCQSVNYRIKKVDINDTGNYSCTAVDNATTTYQKQLHLNIHNRNSPQCFRNGTMGIPYNVGDVLFMSCYCSITENRSCEWLKTDVNKKTGELITPEKTTTRDKTVLRIAINVTDNEIRYDCFFGSSANERCSIGGTVNSSRDTVLNSVLASSNFTSHCHPPKFNTGVLTTALPDTFFTTLVPFVEDFSYNVIIFIAIGIVIFLTCLLAFSIVTLICLKSSRNDDVVDKKSQANETQNPEMIYNSAYGDYGTEDNSQTLRKGNITEYSTSSFKLSDQTLGNGAYQDAYETANCSENSGEKDAYHIYTGTTKNMDKCRNEAVDNDNSAAYAEVNTDKTIPSSTSKTWLDPAEIPAGQRERQNSDFSELYARVDKTGRQSYLV